MNRLDTEISPYLLEHASNPVDWQPWDEIALLRAKEENKPIFLSIGYSACHWCHVMAGESFSNTKVASILNQNFISIKVDREERPDIDKIYMDALVSMTGHGGWPLSAFLTPDGYPFYMGTYFPLYPKHGLPGFIDILTRIASIYAENSTELKSQSIELSKNFVNSGIFQPNTGEHSETSSVSKILTNIFKHFDFTNGGWGSQPKFPNSLVLMLLLDKQFYSQDLSSSVIELTLNRMAQGGFYDIVRGGFHRYSTDKNWLIPHFEKMLYDNALLAMTYLFAGQKSNNEKFLNISKRTLDFMKKELLSPNEGFWSSLDADSEGKEGEYYIWSQKEIINSFTPEEYEIIRGVFVLDNSVLFENKYILRFRNNYTENFFEEKLLLNQKNRVRPNTDDKLLVDWNSLAISAFAKAGLFLQNEEYKEIAIRVLEFILSNLYLDNRLYHSYRLGKIGKIGLLSDYSFLLNALIDVFLIDHNYRWLEIAFQICDEMVDLFWDGKQFFDTGMDDSGLIVRPQTLEDSVIPSGWSMAILAIQKINIFRVQEKYTEIVSSSINMLLQIIQNNPNFYPVWLKNLYVLNNMPETVVLIKENDTLNESIKIEQQILQIINPDTILLSLNANSKLFGVLDLLKGKSTTGNRTTIYLCTHNTCSQPLNTIDEFIEEFRIRNQTSTNAL